MWENPFAYCAFKQCLPLQQMKQYIPIRKSVFVPHEIVSITMASLQDNQVTGQNTTNFVELMCLILFPLLKIDLWEHKEINFITSCHVRRKRLYVAQEGNGAYQSPVNTVPVFKHCRKFSLGRCLYIKYTISSFHFPFESDIFLLKVPILS